MTLYSMQNPTFVAYAVAASIMILKIMGQGWMTVYRMNKIEGGYLNPEDLLPGPINLNPRPSALLAFWCPTVRLGVRMTPDTGHRTVTALALAGVLPCNRPSVRVPRDSDGSRLVSDGSRLVSICPQVTIAPLTAMHGQLHGRRLLHGVVFVHGVVLLHGVVLPLTRRRGRKRARPSAPGSQAQPEDRHGLRAAQ
jgi:hypothetical protein